VNRTLPTFYSEPQMLSLARCPNPSTLKGQRDRAILAVLLSSGLRASELCQLQCRDVRPSLVFVRRGKFGAQRFVPLSHRAWLTVSAYLARHPAKPTDPLFRTLAGQPLTRRLLHKIVTGYSRRLGLKGGVHACRHSFATRALNKGMNLQSVRAMLGHVRIATTALYLGIATRALVAEYQRCLETPEGGGTR